MSRPPAPAYTLNLVVRMRAGLVLLLVFGCGEEPMATVDAEPAMTLDAQTIEPEKDAGEPEEDAGFEADASQPADSGEMMPVEDRFIGSPCAADTDCNYAGGVCLTDGFPMGHCSLPCDRLCPDLEGFPTTFCVSVTGLPSAGPITSPGACVSRCSFPDFPENGCREGYGCVDIARVNEPATVRNACIAGAETNIDDCLLQLAATGIDFEPTTIADQSPSTHPNLTCHVEEPVIIHPPVNGIDLKYYDGTATPNVRAACNMALALVKSMEDVAAKGVTAVRHIGTYNCRVIAGTDRLSRHAYGDAIDIYGFEFADGSFYTLIDHWEHDTTAPMSMEAIFLYETAYRWHDEMFWTIILTPNYNAAHDNHFHVDLTPGSDTINLLPHDFPYVGPAPYGD